MAKAKAKSNRCEGWRRYGGLMTFGPVSWKQCKERGIVMLTVKQDGKTKTLPACKACWAECIASGIKILKAAPL